MRMPRSVHRVWLTFCCLLVAAGLLAQTQTQQPASNPPFVPQVGQAGKDVVWVPTPQTLVDKMLDMAKVTPQDYVIDWVRVWQGTSPPSIIPMPAPPP